MSIQNKNPFSIKSYNADNLKLFLALKEIKEAVLKIRQELGIPLNGFKTDGAFKVWQQASDKSLDLYQQGKLKFDDTLHGKFTASLKNLLFKHGLTEDFYRPLANYINFENVGMVPLANYATIFNKPKKNNDHLEFTIHIYRKLGTKDWKDIQRQVRYYENKYLPENRNIITKFKSQIDRDLVIDSLSDDLGVHKEVIINSDYVERAIKANSEGKLSNAQLKETLKKHKDKIIVKKHRVTSKTIAKKLFKDNASKKSDLVRQVSKRIKKEQKRRFSNL